MVVKEWINQAYFNLLNNYLNKANEIDVSDFSERMFAQNFPSTLQRYFQPEKQYLESIAKELNPYFQDFTLEIRKNFAPGFLKIKKRNLENLFSFSDEKKQKEFCNKLNQITEEISYATEISLAEFYRIWEVKYNLPIVGNFWKKALKEKTGEEDLPDIETSKRFIKQELNELKEILKEYSGNLKIDSVSKEDTIRNYHNRMHKISNNRRLLAYDYEAGMYTPKPAKESLNGLEKLTLQEKTKRTKNYIKSDYNGFFERLLSNIGLFFRCIFNKQ